MPKVAEKCFLHIFRPDRLAPARRGISGEASYRGFIGKLMLLGRSRPDPILQRRHYYGSALTYEYPGPQSCRRLLARCRIGLTVSGVSPTACPTRHGSGSHQVKTWLYRAGPLQGRRVDLPPPLPRSSPGADQLACCRHVPAFGRPLGREGGGGGPFDLMPGTFCTLVLLRGCLWPLIP